MNRPLHWIAAMIALVIAVGLAACAPDPADARPDYTAIVVAQTMGAVSLTPGDLDRALDRVDTEDDRLVVAVADGSPRVVIDVTLPELPGRSSEREDWLEQFRTDMRTAILASRAEEPESDLTEAIALVAQPFRGGAGHSLTVLGSGLQTTGALSLLDGRLYAEPDDLIAHLEQTGGLPDLKGVSVVMPKLGVVTDPQPQLDEAARTQLASIWEAYFARAGATEVALAVTSLRSDVLDLDDLPRVTPVPIDRSDPVALQPCRQLLGASAIGFAAKSAEILDERSARAVLTEVHEALAGCEGPYVVEGSASSEGTENTALSLRRAQAVAALFSEVSMEPVGDMDIIGWGVTWPCRVPDLDAEGDLLLDAATANRVVVVSKGAAGC